MAACGGRWQKDRAVIGLAEEEGAEAFFSALESGLTAETQKKDRTTMPGMSENPFDKVFLVPLAGTDAAMTERLLEKARYHFDAELCGSLAEAVELARANSRRGLLICGGEAIALEAADLRKERIPSRAPFDIVLSISPDIFASNA